MSSTAFQDSAQAAASGISGVLSITFQSVRLGYIWTGSVQVPSAVSLSVLPVKFTAFDAGIPIGSWYNDQSSSDLQVQQQLSITATGLAIGTYRAFFKGMVTPAEETVPSWPGPTPAPPPGLPQTLVNIAGFLPGAGSSLLSAYPSQSAPVLLGTSLEVLLFGAATNSARLTITWSLTATGARTSQYTFDVPNAAILNPVTGGASVLSGLVLPNLGNFVQIVAANATPATGTIDAIINTGLPPITRPPIVPLGTLFYSLPALGASTVNLPPYAGPVSVMMVPNNTAGFGIEVKSFDYLGNLACETRHEQGWPAGTGPFVSQGLIYLPPLVNQVSITGAPAGAAISGVILGP